jgi:hypothetical protein
LLAFFAFFAGSFFALCGVGGVCSMRRSTSFSSFVGGGFLVAVMRKTPSLEVPEASRLSFDTGQDALDYAAEVTQEFDGWLRQSQANIVKAYKDGQIELLLQFRCPLPLPSHWPISIRSGMVHLVGHGIERKSTPALERDLDHGDMGFCSQQGLMLLKAGQLVECPEGVVPSSVWLKRSHEIKHCGGDVLRPVSPLRVQINGVVTERKVSVVASFPDGHCDEVAGMVKSTAQVDQRIACESADPVGKRLREPEEAEIVSWIERIVLNDQCVWLTLSEAATEFIDLIDVRFGVLDGEPADF